MAPALASWIERFLDHLRVERQLSPHTLNNYRLHLQELGPLAQQLGLAQWSELK
ncbi:MAG: site-specific integrase, partial [Aeromonas sp.]|nr:site-specific integrase [Aeromonas sp.]